MQSNTAQARTKVSRAQDDQASRKQVWSSQGTHGPKSGEEFPEQVRPPELGQGWGAVGSGLFRVLSLTWGEQAKQAKGVRELKCVWWRAGSLEPAGSKGTCQVSSRGLRPRRGLSRLGWSMRVGRGGTRRRRVYSRTRGLSRGRPHSTRACSRQAHSRPAGRGRSCCRLAGSRGWTRSSLEHR